MNDFVYCIEQICNGIVYFTTNDELARKAYNAGLRVTCKHKNFRKIFKGSNKTTSSPNIMG